MTKPVTHRTDSLPRPELREESFQLVHHLAHAQFIRLKIGTSADFEKLWRNARLAGKSSGLVEKP
jgi:hypothetical protein